MCVADELGTERGEKLADKFQEIGIEYISFKMSKKTGDERNLAASYNQALRFAREMDCDGFVSLQDYIWIPEDGIQRFIDASEKIDDPHILTGICHITEDPTPDKVVDVENYFSIFAEPYDEEPTTIKWEDVRKVNNEKFTADPEALLSTSPVEWEANWAYIPREALHDTRLRYDEDFDRYVAYENQDYAYRALELGYFTMIDTHNIAKSLPHKAYWPEQEAHEGPLTEFNRQLIEEKYNV
jgi:GT2 family glycosyltransferase